MLDLMPIVSTDEMRCVLQEAERYKVSPPEETLFSISGRGHLENPTTDLLCYFMQPEAQHGFGTCFLRAFFECMDVDLNTLKFDSVELIPQAHTRDGNWIDLLIVAADWVLVIENKLHAPLNNPLASYVNHASLFGKERAFFALLSPHPLIAPDWKSVTYRDYCNGLKNTLPEEVFKLPWASKWHVFGREFIVYLERELYNSEMTMTSEQIEFVEANLPTIEHIKVLSTSYREFLRNHVRKHLLAEIPGHEFQFVDSWAFLCDEDASDHAHVQLFFAAPFHVNDWPRDERFRIGLRLCGEDDIRKLDGLGIRCCPDGASVFCQCEKDFRRSGDAITELCSLTKRVFALLAD